MSHPTLFLSRLFRLATPRKAFALARHSFVAAVNFVNVAGIWSQSFLTVMARLSSRISKVLCSRDFRVTCDRASYFGFLRTLKSASFVWQQMGKLWYIHLPFMAGLYAVRRKK